RPLTQTSEGGGSAPHGGLRSGRAHDLGTSHGRGDCLPGVERPNARWAVALGDALGSVRPCCVVSIAGAADVAPPPRLAKLPSSPATAREAGRVFLQTTTRQKTADLCETERLLRIGLCLCMLDTTQLR